MKTRLVENIVVSLLLAAFAAVAVWAWDLNSVYPRKKYVAGSTSSSVEISSTTLNFTVAEMSFAVRGTGYALIKSSFSSTASDEIFVNSSISFDTQVYPAVEFKGTAKKFNFILQPDTTLYYYIGGAW